MSLLLKQHLPYMHQSSSWQIEPNHPCGHDDGNQFLYQVSRQVFQEDTRRSRLKVCYVFILCASCIHSSISTCICLYVLIINFHDSLIMQLVSKRLLLSIWLVAALAQWNDLATSRLSITTRHCILCSAYNSWIAFMCSWWTWSIPLSYRLSKSLLVLW